MSKFLLFADTETTGLPLPDRSIPADAPGQPRVASMAGILVRAEDRKVMSSFDLKVLPVGWEMPADLERVHGLTTQLLLQVGQPINVVLNLYRHAIALGAVVVFHNAAFDLKLLRGELRRAGWEDLYDETPHVCTLRATPEECKYQLGNKRLGTVYEWLTGKKPPPGASHPAMGDTLMVREVYFKLLERGVDLTPRVHKVH